MPKPIETQYDRDQRERAAQHKDWLDAYQARMAEQNSIDEAIKVQRRTSAITELSRQARVAIASARSWRQLAEGLAAELKRWRGVDQ